MPMRHAQRKHIIQSLNSLLYQLHTVSFLLSPGLLPLLCRIGTQFHFSRPRDADSQRSLRFWFVLVVLVNLQSLYIHIFKGPAEGRSIILDFVGVAHKPSKAHLLFLDTLIIFLEFILLIIAYETSFVLASPLGTQDPLLPAQTPSAASPVVLGNAESKPLNSETPVYDESEYIVDIQLVPLLQRLSNPPSPPPPQQHLISDELLPLPNTTSFQLSQNLNMLMRARARMRERAARAADNPRRDQPERSVPGGLREEVDNHS